jgi:hypothetical protein
MTPLAARIRLLRPTALVGATPIAGCSGSPATSEAKTAPSSPGQAFNRRVEIVLRVGK